MLSRLKKVVVPVVLVATLAGCSLSYYRHTSHGDYLDINGSDVNVSMSLHGKIRVNDPETEIEYLAPGSRIKVSKRDLTGRRNLVLRGLADGEVGMEYEVNGKRAEFDDEAKAWLASVVPILYSQSGVNIPQRVEKLYREGGEKLVLDRIEPINSDYNQGQYLSYLYETKSLSAETIDRSMKLLSNIQSDFELAKTLRTLATSQSLSEAQWIQLLERSKKIESDFEMAKLFTSLRRVDLPGDVLTELSYVTAGYIQSDFEQAKVLKSLSRSRQFNQQQWLALLDSSKAIQSDHELTKVLEEVLSNEINETILLNVVDITSSHISSSSNQAEVLTKLIRRNDVTPALKRALTIAIEDISSTFEQNKLLKLLIA